MIVLDWQAGDVRHHIVALFGMGLIGSSILAPIVQQATETRSRRLSFTWQRDEKVAHQSAEILSYLAGLVQQGGRLDPHSLHIDFVWAAGKGGFQGNVEEFSDELQAFDRVLEMAGSLAHRFPEGSHGFHLVSSAGGLFEGQRFIDADTEPRPRRPYGEVKLKQEVKLSSVHLGASMFIYRPSTIYGYKVGGRLGLVATLVKNAVNNRTTRIFGDLGTIRDYVFVKDVGNFVAGKVIRRTEQVGLNQFLLASGKPTSMHEIVGLVGRNLQRRLFLKFDSAPTNAGHMSFRSSGLPWDWSATPLSYGVYRTVTDIASDFALRR